MATVEALCISERKGEPKRPVEQATFETNRGLAGDAHAGAWHRQVSILASEDVAAVRRRLPDVAPGGLLRMPRLRTLLSLLGRRAHG